MSRCLYNSSFKQFMTADENSSRVLSGFYFEGDDFYGSAENREAWEPYNKDFYTGCRAQLYIKL